MDRAAGRQPGTARRGALASRRAWRGRARSQPEPPAAPSRPVRGGSRPTSPRALATPLEIRSVKPIATAGHEHRRDRGGTAEPPDQSERQHHQEHRHERTRRSAGAARSGKAPAPAGRSRRRRRSPAVGRSPSSRGGRASSWMRSTSISPGQSSVGSRSTVRSATLARVTSCSRQPPWMSAWPRRRRCARSGCRPAPRRKIEISCTLPTAIAFADSRTMSLPLRSQ